MALSKAGADRQKMHERMRELSMAAWQSIEDGAGNPLIELVCKESEFSNYLSADDLRGLFDTSRYLGDAPHRARQLSEYIRQSVS